MFSAASVPLTQGLVDVTTGLEFPEGGPIWLDDGSVLLVEIKKGTLTRVLADGTKRVVATTGGGPNSSAVGPDGFLYITQNGGFSWTEITRPGGAKLTLPGHQPADYVTGSIQKVNPRTGEVVTLYTSGVGVDGSTVKLCGPNDLVFDASGGFYFTDHGKTRSRDRDRVGVFYALPDGSKCSEIVFPMEVSDSRVGHCLLLADSCLAFHPVPRLSLAGGALRPRTAAPSPPTGVTST
jgi:gluconolactonase